MEREEFRKLLLNNSFNKKEWDWQLESQGQREFLKELNMQQFPESNRHTADHLNSIHTNPLTDIEDEFLKKIFLLVKDFLLPDEREMVDNVHFMQEWLDSFNAKAFRVESEDRVVIINKGSTVSLAYASIAYTHCAVSTPGSKTYPNDIVKLFIASLEPLRLAQISSAFDVRAVHHKLLLSDNYKAAFADMLMVAMLCFIVSHELAHHILGHQGRLVNFAEIRYESERYYKYSRQKEFEADRYAWNLFRKIQSEMSKDEHIGEPLSMSPYCIVAPILLMTIIESLQTLRSASHLKKASRYSSHPSGYERRIALESLVVNFLDDDIMTFIDSINFFFFKTIPVYFSGCSSENMPSFICSNILDNYTRQR